MISILLNGCNGKMGQNIVQCARFRNDLAIVAGLDICPNENAPFGIYRHCRHQEKNRSDHRFSRPNSLGRILGYAMEKKLPIVIATTGFSQEQKEIIEKAGSEIRCFSQQYVTGCKPAYPTGQDGRKTLYGF